MNSKNLIFSLITPPLSLLIGIALLESSWRVWQGHSANVSVDSSREVRFIQGHPAAFRNHHEIFTYAPNATIRYKAVFYSQNSQSTDFDTVFHTNNFGLVQDSDLELQKPSLLFLGDSFTQGEGAAPWFNAIAPKINPLGLQPINGGLIGTGFKQFQKLEEHLERSGVHIAKLLVIFISDDFQRSVWNFKKAQLDCIHQHAPCSGREKYLALPSEPETAHVLDKVRAARADKQTWIDQFTTAAVTMMPATTTITQSLWVQIAPHLPNSGLAARFKGSRNAIADLQKRFGKGNVAFIHLPQKDEVDRGPNSLGLAARRAIADAHGELFDGFAECKLELTDYYQNDAHPNIHGYAKIAACVQRALPLIGLSDTEPTGWSASNTRRAESQHPSRSGASVDPHQTTAQ